MKIFYIILAAGILSLTSSCAEAVFLSGCASYRETGGASVIIETGRAEFKVDVEIAYTGEEKRKGLMGRKSLPGNRGMLFIYNEERNRTFWMKNTFLNLDMIFADSDGKIVDINSNASSGSTETFTSAPAKYVLEVEGGYCNEKGVKKGDMIRIGRTGAER